jgi:hypothetical protein
VSDQHPTQPLPDPSAVGAVDGCRGIRPRRSRRWPWLIAVLAVAVLAVGAWFAGEYIARGIVERTIREQVAQPRPARRPADRRRCARAGDAAADRGRLDDVTVSAADVSLGADRRRRGARRGCADPRRRPLQCARDRALDQDQVQALLGTVDGFPRMPSRSRPRHRDVDGAAAVRPLGARRREPHARRPAATSCSPRTLRVSGAEVSADVLIDQFGALARTVVRDWDVCVKQYLPAGLTLSGVRVDGAQVVADIAVDPRITVDAALQQKGTCG